MPSVDHTHLENTILIDGPRKGIKSKSKYFTCYQRSIGLIFIYKTVCERETKYAIPHPHTLTIPPFKIVNISGRNFHVCPHGDRMVYNTMFRHKSHLYTVISFQKTYGFN